jgi:hypothetical protein
MGMLIVGSDTIVFSGGSLEGFAPCKSQNPGSTALPTPEHEFADRFLHAAWGLKKEINKTRSSAPSSIPFCGDDQRSGAVPILLLNSFSFT